MTYLNIYGFGIKAFQIRHFKIKIQIQVSKCNLNDSLTSILDEGLTLMTPNVHSYIAQEMVVDHQSRWGFRTSQSGC